MKPLYLATTRREISAARGSFKAVSAEWGPLQNLFLDVMEDLQFADLIEIERLTKRWGRRGVSYHTLARWRQSFTAAQGVKCPHARTLSIVAEALGYTITWKRGTNFPRYIRRIK